MTYEEIEAILKKHRYMITIETLRAAVGEEGLDLFQNTQVPSEDEAMARAREYFAEDITAFLVKEKQLDPSDVLHHRARYVRSWAFARIIEELEDSLVNPAPEEDRVLGIDEMITRLCTANTDLTLKFADMMGQANNGVIADRHMQTLETIMEALDSVKAPSMNELGSRDLSVVERVEAVLFEWRDLRTRVQCPKFELVEICEHCKDQENRLMAIEEEAHDLAELVVAMVTKLHAGSHCNEESGEPLLWWNCSHGFCAMVRKKFEDVGLGPDLERIGLVR